MKNIFLIFLVVFVGLFIGCSNPVGMNTSDSESSDSGEIGIDPIPMPSPYPEITWVESSVSTSGISTQSTAANTPSLNTFFDYKSLTFSATYNGETGDFVFTQAVTTDSINFSTGLRDGSLSFFTNHTIEVDVLWETEVGDFYEETFVTSYNPTIGWEFVMGSFLISGIDGPVKNVGTAADHVYNSAFKEIRFIADDGTTYHTWTNPDL